MAAGLSIAAITACSKPSERLTSKQAAVRYGALDCERTYLGVLSYTELSYEQVTHWPGPDLHCSTNYLGDGWLLTAGHCIAKAVGPRAVALNGWWYPLAEINPSAEYATAIAHTYTSAAGDLALLRIDLSLPGVVRPEDRTDAHRVWPTTVAVDPPAAHARVRYLGHSTLVNTEEQEHDGDWTRRFRYVWVQSVSGGVTTYLDWGDRPGVGGDSGGSTVAVENGVEKIIGIHHDGINDADAVAERAWIDSNCSGCLTAWNRAPAGYVAEDRVSAFCEGQWGDPDQDGVPAWRDNCPTVANADQRNCGNWSDDVLLHDPETLGPAMQLGDACDPNACVDIQALLPVSSPGGNHHYVKGDKVAVAYRATGYAQGQSSTSYAIEAMYCGCRRRMQSAEATKASPDLYDDMDCVRYICTDGYDYDPQLETGWQKVIWRQSAASCSLVDADASDGATILNDCLDDLPMQTFRRPYAGSSVSGQNPRDAQAFWTALGRTTSFEWSWRLQDLPHDGTTAYDPFSGNSVERAKVRLRLKPLVTYASGYTHRSTLTQPMTLAVSLLPTDFARLEPFAGERWLVVDPPPTLMGQPPAAWLPNLDVGSRVLRPLREPREAIEGFLWPDIGADSATVGLMAATYSHETGLFSDLLGSEVLSGGSLDTVRFATAVVGSDLYLYGGEDGAEALSGRLWRGRVGISPTTGQRAMLWQELEADVRPAPRKDAILVADLAQQRLLLLFGQGDEGASGEAFAFDVQSSSWSSLDLSGPAHLPRSNACASADGGVVYYYGGVASGEELEGLYRLDLSTLLVQRMDSEALPGQRQGCALSYDATNKSLYLYGGRSSGSALHDLWSYDLAAGLWQQVATGPEELASQAPERASLSVSRLDGTVRLLAGDHEDGQPQPAWSFDGTQWGSYESLLGGQQ